MASRYGGGVFVVDTRESMVRGRDTSIRESPDERGQNEPGRVRREDKGEQQRSCQPRGPVWATRSPKRLT